jgi:hypothetical protein
MQFVLNCSVAISWYFVDEKNPQNQSRKFSPNEIAAIVPATEILP